MRWREIFKKIPDHFGSGLILENGKKLKKSWNSIEVNTIKLEKLPGRRLEDAISEDPLLTRLGISTQVMNGPTTEMWITAFEDEKPVNVYIKSQSDSFITNQEIQKRIRDNNKAQMEARNLLDSIRNGANSKFYKTLDKEIKKWIKCLLQKKI